MCGIAGFSNLRNSWLENINRMNRSMLHRGPDAGGVWSSDDNSVVLGHRRLSILDLSETGAQPMISHDKRYVIAFNGEIYNFELLKTRLKEERQSSGFRGRSDTEVFLEYISCYGLDEALTVSKGMFSFALYDREERKVFLARDRFGEKPLYYSFASGGFLFASELRTLTVHDAFTSEIDKNAIAIFLARGYIPAPYSIYKDVKKLAPGSVLEYDVANNEYSIKCYWDIFKVADKNAGERFTGSFSEAADELERLISESISLQMVADVQVGAFLSGGIDSSTIVTIMQSQSNRPIRSFSIGFKDSVNDEAGYAAEVAKHIGTNHTEKYVSASDVIDAVPKTVSLYSEPFADSSAVATYIVSELARQDVTVSLSGDAGDELFCGYPRYWQINSIWNRMGVAPYVVRKMIAGFDNLFCGYGNNSLNKISHYLKAVDGYDLFDRINTVVPGTEKLLLKSDVSYSSLIREYDWPKTRNLKYIEQLMTDELLLELSDDILAKVDRAAMAVSLETRIPLLDKDIVEFALSLPVKYKYENGVGKRVLKEVLYRHVPRELIERPKRGFALPISEWMKKGRMREWMEDMLNERDLASDGLINTKVLKNMKKAFLEGKTDGRVLWNLCVYEQWKSTSRSIV